MNEKVEKKDLIDLWLRLYQDVMKIYPEQFELRARILENIGRLGGNVEMNVQE